jgi:hypothetical protein
MLELSPMNPDDLRPWLLDSITHRFRSNAGLSLSDYIFSNSLFHTIEDEQVQFMFDHRLQIVDTLSSPQAVAELVAHCIDSTKRYTYERNQFVNFTSEYEELMNAEYTDFIHQIRTALEKCETEAKLERALIGILELHHERLRLIMASYCVTYQDQDLQANPLLRTVPCEEYSAGFQLSLLGLDLNSLIQPVLDLGCGSNGALVKFLRQQGIEAYGVDRLAPREKYFVQSDWFTFDFDRASWGCILAHQSLSIHFIYAYLHQPASTGKFSRLSMSILSAMQEDSFLCYAPGMPFFEEQVEKMEDYLVMRHKISMHLPEVEQISYSTRIQRAKHRFFSSPYDPDIAPA